LYTVVEECRARILSRGCRAPVTPSFAQKQLLPAATRPSAGSLSFTVLTTFVWRQLAVSRSYVTTGRAKITTFDPEIATIHRHFPGYTAERDLRTLDMDVDVYMQLNLRRRLSRGCPRSRSAKDVGRDIVHATKLIYDPWHRASSSIYYPKDLERTILSQFL
jgi:hypothetical protein